MSKQIMKAGYYYIGDPCYVVDDDWKDFVTKIFENSFEGYSKPFKFKGENCWVHGTYFGDGVYYDNLGNEYSVDSGSIGVIEIGVFMDNIPPGEIDAGIIEEFLEDFEVGYRDGVFHIADVKINTQGVDSF